MRRLPSWSSRALVCGAPRRNFGTAVHAAKSRLEISFPRSLARSLTRLVCAEKYSGGVQCVERERGTWCVVAVVVLYAPLCKCVVFVLLQNVLRELEQKKPQLDELVHTAEHLKADSNRQQLHGKGEYIFSSFILPFCERNNMRLLLAIVVCSACDTPPSFFGRRPTSDLYST
jgi:hypothetical protein